MAVRDNDRAPALERRISASTRSFFRRGRELRRGRRDAGIRTRLPGGALALFGAALVALFLVPGRQREIGPDIETLAPALREAERVEAD